MILRLLRWGVLAAWLLPVLLAAQDVPSLTRHVTDQTGTLSATQVDQLDAQLVELERSKGAQLVVLMVASTAPQAIEEYSLAVAEKNRIGRKGTDDGVLLLIAKNDHRVRIEVGYGLEGAIPDAANARIIREYIAPKFRANDYFGGISDAVGALTQLINGESLPPPVQGVPEPRRGVDFGNVIWLGFIALMVLRGVLGRAPVWLRSPLGGVITGGVVWVLVQTLGAGILGALIGALCMLIPAGAGRSIGGGGWGGWGGFGGGGFGGGSGGGFGGGGGFSGGGGSFGGGGASGSW